MKEKCKTVEQQKFEVSEEVVVLTRQLSHPLGSGFPSIAYPQKPLMHSFTKKTNTNPSYFSHLYLQYFLGKSLPV
jgi:hypothetical protein